jgi:hypothetical protein
MYRLIDGSYNDRKKVHRYKIIGTIQQGSVKFSAAPDRQRVTDGAILEDRLEFVSRWNFGFQKNQFLFSYFLYVFCIIV